MSLNHSQFAYIWMWKLAVCHIVQSICRAFRLLLPHLVDWNSKRCLPKLYSRYCLAGTEEKLAFCKSIGADVGINYKTEDFVARIKEETGGHFLFFLDWTMIIWHYAITQFILDKNILCHDKRVNNVTSFHKILIYLLNYLT